jgi:hypothetical protein
LNGLFRLHPKGLAQLFIKEVSKAIKEMSFKELFVMLLKNFTTIITVKT